MEYNKYSGRSAEKTGVYRKKTQERPDRKDGGAPGNKGAGAKQYASQEETSKLQPSFQSNNNNTQS